MKTIDALKRSLRVIWAIAWKDIVDALKNKTILSVFASVAFTVAMYKALPYLDGQNEMPNLLLFDAGNSALTMQLEESPNLKLYAFDDQEHMLSSLTRADYMEIGLVLPPDLDQQIENGEAVELAGYAAYWLPTDKVAEVQQLVEDEITYYSGQPVTINISDPRLYPQNPNEPSSGFMVSIAVVLVLTMLGMLVIVHLMLEEKQTKTIDALRVSPATPLEMILGKAITGTVYSVIGVAAVLAINLSYITNWGLVLGATLCGTLFTVSLGILLGTLFDSRQQLVLWGFLLMNVLLLPMFLVIMADLLPATLIGIFRWVPTSAIAWLIRATFAPSAPTGQAVLRLGYLLLCAAAVFALASWRMARLEN